MRKKWGMKTKRLQKPRKQILSAFLVCMLLTGLFLSAANMEVAAASGLVDETIDAGNLYSQYRWDNYQIDFYVDTSWDWLPWNWMDRIDNKISSVFYGISDGIWLIIDRGRLHGICRADQKKNHRGSQRSGKYACDLSFNCRVYCLCAAVH